jgi:chromosome transmission fidelity protein 8
MLIDVAVSSSSTFNPKLPPCIAKFDHDQLVLIELQGTLDIECGEDATRDGQFVGKLNLKDAVCGVLSVTDDHLTDF